jgi:hypothetical protein
VRWLDDVDQDSERVGERHWRRQDRNRNEWKKLLRKAKTHWNRQSIGDGGGCGGGGGAYL